MFTREIKGDRLKFIVSAEKGYSDLVSLEIESDDGMRFVIINNDDQEMRRLGLALIDACNSLSQKSEAK